MLVLTRKIGEALIIGDARVVLMKAQGHDTVRLGIEAPRDVKILREELIDRQPPERPVAA